MAKIIKFDSSRKLPESKRSAKRSDCDHKQVIAYTVYRTVRCSICGMELDPFDVLVDMLKAYVPEEANLEEKKLLREVEKRTGQKSKEEDK